MPTCAAAEHAAVSCEEGVIADALYVAGQQLAEHHCCCSLQHRAQVLTHLRGGYAQLGLVLGLLLGVGVVLVCGVCVGGVVGGVVGGKGRREGQIERVCM